MLVMEHTLLVAIGFARAPRVAHALAELVPADPGLWYLTPLAYGGLCVWRYPGWRRPRGARACLPWAMVFNAVGICRRNVCRVTRGGAGTRVARAC